MIVELTVVIACMHHPEMPGQLMHRGRRDPPPRCACPVSRQMPTSQVSSAPRIHSRSRIRPANKCGSMFSSTRPTPRLPAVKERLVENSDGILQTPETLVIRQRRVFGPGMNHKIADVENARRRRPPGTTPSSRNRGHEDPAR